MTPLLPGIVFDLDGTLIDSAPEIHAVANRVFGHQGLPALPFGVIRGFIGNGLPVLVARCLVAHGKATDADRISELCEAFEAEYEKAFDLTTLYPGVKNALQRTVDIGFSLAICTNKPMVPTRSVLHHFDLLQYFPVILAGDSLPQRKPDPAPLQQTRTELGTASIIFVGDSEVDAATALAARVPFWLFANGYRKKDAQDLGAEWIFEDYAALPERLFGYCEQT